MFYPDGTATAGLKVWNYVKTGAKVTKIGVEDIETADVTSEEGKEIELPKTVNVTYNTEKVEENVVWNTEGIDFSKAGTYTVEGTVKFSRKIERGAYKDKTSGTTKCTVVIKQKNLITDADDAGLEKADNFTVNNKIVDSVSSTKDDKKSGEACAHWYNGGEDKTEAAITYNKAITLASGEYIFEYVGQGADGDELYAEVMDSEGNIIAKGDNVTLTGWKNWKTPSVSFKLEKETKVTLVVGIVSAKVAGEQLMTYTYIRQSQLTRVMPIMVIPVMMKTRSRIPHLLMIITRTIQVAVILPLTRIMAQTKMMPTKAAQQYQQQHRPHSLQRFLHWERLYQAHPTPKQL